MAIIKGQSAANVASRAVVLDLGDLEAHGERLRAQAREQAEQIIAQAKAEAASLTDGAAEAGDARGYEQGMARGIEEGTAAGRASAFAEASERAKQLAASLQTMIDQWQTQRADLHERARQDLLRFACAVAERVIHRALSLDEQSVRPILDDALALVQHPTSLDIAVHPDDLEVLEAMVPEIQSRLGDATALRLTPDDQLTPGGCLLRSPGGVVDASIETQLERIVSALLPPKQDDETQSDSPDDPEPGNESAPPPESS